MTERNDHRGSTTDVFSVALIEGRSSAAPAGTSAHCAASKYIWSPPDAWG